jgi:hypothetical protein
MRLRYAARDHSGRRAAITATVDEYAFGAAALALAKGAL